MTPMAGGFKRIFIASDHAGVEMKAHLIGSLPALPWKDLGTNSNASVDYPDFATALVHELEPRLKDAFGVLICGSGQGMAIAANRHQAIRAALCWNEEVAGLARQHNDANVLCLASRITPVADALRIFQTFAQTPFEGGRHQRRIEKLCF